MSNIGFKSESTVKIYRKVENMWNDCSDNTGVFTKMSNMEKHDIEVASGMQLVTSLNVFSTWMLTQFLTVLDGQKKLLRGQELISNTIGTVCVMLEKKKYFTFY